MILERPLWLLALALVPLLLLLEALRGRSRETVVSSLALWEGLLEDRRDAWTRAIRALPPQGICRAGALAAAVLALAGPALSRRSPPAPLLVAIDRSASMGAKVSGGGTRLDRARAAATRILDREPTDRSVRLVGLPGGPDLLLASPSDAIEALETMTVTDAPLDPAPELARLAASGEGEGLWITDEGVEGLPRGFEALGVGEPAENAGWVAFEVLGDAREPGELWGLLRNLGAHPVDREVAAFGDAEHPLGLVGLEAGASREFRVPIPEGAVVGLRCLGADALAPDDEVRAARGARSLRVALDPSVPEAVARALAACEGVAVARAAAASSPDLTVGFEEGAGGFRIRLDDPAGEAFLVESLRFATALPSDVEVGPVSPFQARAAEGGTPLLLGRDGSGEERAIAFEDERGWRLHFAPEDSEWKDRASFPIFFAVAVERARARAGRWGFRETGDPSEGDEEPALRAGVFAGEAFNLLSARESSLPAFSGRRGGREAREEAEAEVRRSLASVPCALAAALVGAAALLEAKRRKT